MISSSLIMAIGGVLLQFLPHEILNYFGTPSTGITPLFFQLAGALYLGFAMMNWMAKTVLIGGIYARPLAMGNFVHFLVGALAFLKYAFSNGGSPAVWILVTIYCLFAVLFGYVFFTHPSKVKNVNSNSTP
jgi:hypothetical protein